MNEAKVLIACIANAEKNTGSEFAFGFSDEIAESVSTMKPKSVVGYLGDLSKKDLIYVDKEYGQLVLSNATFEILGVNNNEEISGVDYAKLLMEHAGWCERHLVS